MKLRLKHFKQSGDTVVEVMIAIAVISSVIVGAYIVTQKSTLAVRDSQEHGEMLQVLQGQVELVRSMALTETNPNGGVFASSPKYFCIDGTDTANPARLNSPAVAVPLPGLENDDFSKYADKCSNIQTRYNIAVTYDAATKVFTFTGRWDGVNGRRSQEQLVYRILPAI